MKSVSSYDIADQFGGKFIKNQTELDILHENPDLFGNSLAAVWDSCIFCCFPSGLISLTKDPACSEIKLYAHCK